MRKIVLLLSGLLWAALLSQFPEYYQQYTQRLGGRLDELNLQVANLEKRAAQAGLTRYEYVRRFLGNRDPVIVSEGENLRDLIGRQIAYTRAFDALQTSKPVWRAARFIEHFDSDIGLPTLDTYRPAIPLTAEGAIYTGTGFFVGWLLTFGFFGRKRRRKPAPERREPDIYA